MIDFEKLDDIAWAESTVPDGLNAVELIYYLCIAEIYRGYRSGSVKKADAEKFKKSLRREVREVLERYAFEIKCWNYAATRYKAMESALANYRKNPDAPNADALADACYGVLKGVEQCG